MTGKNFDLNLLIVLDAVLIEGNVTRAAARLDMSQGSVSKALAQLRLIFGDPLFIRSRKGMIPTHKALGLAPIVRQALGAVDRLATADQRFEPDAMPATFNIGASEYATFVLLPTLLAKLAKAAPHVRIVVHDIERSSAEDMLLSGTVDLALSPGDQSAFPLHRQRIFTDRYVCVMRRGHPLAGRPLTVDGFLAHRHLVMPRQNGGREGIVEEALLQLGKTRDVMVSMPHMLSVPAALETTDMVMTSTGRVAHALAQIFPLEILEHPLTLEDFSVFQVWHVRTHRSSSHQWLRELIAHSAQELS